MNKWILFFALVFVSTIQAQQLNCTITVNSERVANTNQSVYKTLQTTLTEFVNKTDWTGKSLKQNERINCSMYITISSNNSDQFVATLQVQSSRPIYNSSYSSPIFNFNDKDFNFRYTEFENLIFNPNGFESNLVSVVSFYAYVILGLDAESFVSKSGDVHFAMAQNIANNAQQGGYKGWNQADGFQSRYFLINDLLSPTFFEIRNTITDYHTGLDTMTKDTKSAKEKIKGALVNISKLNSSKPNAFLTRVFFDAKSDEIVSIFSGGPSVSITDLVESLNKTSPMNTTKWENIKY
ncbi:DUF4835 family protein [Flavobacterium sp. UMI-01]|uniref:type IX secretion system protein PorD n=1 Tax=Flavobacterium sp. UMI-01 TaxID=1441053 RepID=UPI001C7DD75A|nr:DUF4835 family protein [Flavobacterium sp. UMI-01]GIZ07658.1 DUF4835 domain-containing protein [Flavobacterium sp. UMI-01]